MLRTFGSKTAMTSGQCPCLPAGQLDPDERTERDDAGAIQRPIRACSNSAISRSRMATCFRSSRAMPWRSPGVFSSSRTPASSSRFLTSTSLALRRLGLFEDPPALGIVALPIPALCLELRPTLRPARSHPSVCARKSTRPPSRGTAEVTPTSSPIVPRSRKTATR